MLHELNMLFNSYTSLDHYPTSRRDSVSRMAF